MSAVNTAADTIIARQASDYLLPGYTRGHFCGNCGTEVRLSPTAACMVASGANLHCHTCGVPETLAEKEQGLEVRVSTMAAAYEVMEQQAHKGKP